MEELDIKSFNGVLPAELSTDDAGGKHIVHAIVTADIMDADCEAMLSDGMDYTTRYEKNPVVLYDHKGPPIGRCLSIKRNNGFIEADLEFMPRPDTLPEGEEWKPDTYYAMVKSGSLNGVSIGFIPKTVEWRRPTPSDYKRFGPDIKRVAAKFELGEISITPVPANLMTLITSVKNAKGLGSKAIEASEDEKAKLREELEQTKKKNIELEAKLATFPVEHPAVPVVVATKSLEQQVSSEIDAQQAANALFAAVNSEVDRQMALKRGVFFIPK